MADRRALARLRKEAIRVAQHPEHHAAVLAGVRGGRGNARADHAQRDGEGCGGPEGGCHEGRFIIGHPGGHFMADHAQYIGADERGYETSAPSSRSSVPVWSCTTATTCCSPKSP